MSNIRILRGGGWSLKLGYLRSANRGRDYADEADYYVGFRLVQEDLNTAKRVLRGGSWLTKPRYLRSAYRNRSPADEAYNFVGVRLIQEAGDE